MYQNNQRLAMKQLNLKELTANDITYSTCVTFATTGKLPCSMDY